SSTIAITSLRRIFGPVGPGGPAGPVGPTAPVRPDLPVFPVGPRTPRGPMRPFVRLGFGMCPPSTGAKRSARTDRASAHGVDASALRFLRTLGVLTVRSVSTFGESFQQGADALPVPQLSLSVDLEPGPITVSP